ncbi:hypothetical protein N7450_004010 [Penicillium hetheringtonii]|uniref:Serine/threonine-protein kinase ATG1 n=1 Tax=Penicillium hetheringtonii TaxID=911720 RepID=A0AAD6GU07_9EURO|nr:hypothetical protein N7450_004010 [Penicillium hetheringtonii]
MARLPDLVRDSKLETRFLPDFSVETVHIYHWHEAEPAQRRPVSLSEHWKRQRKIGGGGYSTVWLESCPKVSRYGVQLRAVKQIETGGRFARIDFNRELEAIAKFSHPRYERCFVKSFGWYNTPENLFISMEYMELGDLHDYLLDRPVLPETQVQDISYQILEGLQMMHENQFIHRDLKPRNILIKSHPPQEWWVKIGDFGISKRMEENPETSTTLRGTTGFIAPELYGFVNPGSPYSTDIWSFGEIIFQMLTKKPVFKPISQLSSYIRHPETFPSTALSDAGVSASGIDFIQSLMKPKPDDRLTTEAALGHMWTQLASEASTPRADPLGSVESHPILTDEEEQRFEPYDEVNGSSLETLLSRGKTSSAGARATATAVESTGFDSNVKTGGSETLRPTKDRKTGGVRAKYAFIEDCDSNDDSKEFSHLSSGTASDSTESLSSNADVSSRTRPTQSTPVSDGTPHTSDNSRSRKPAAANSITTNRLSVAERIQILEREKKGKARASRESESKKASSTGSTPRIEIRSVKPARIPNSEGCQSNQLRATLTILLQAQTQVPDIPIPRRIRETEIQRSMVMRKLPFLNIGPRIEVNRRARKKRKSHGHEKARLLFHGNYSMSMRYLIWVTLFEKT